MKFTRKQHGMDQPKDAKLQFAVRKWMSMKTQCTVASQFSFIRRLTFILLAMDHLSCHVNFVVIWIILIFLFEPFLPVLIVRCRELLHWITHTHTHTHTLGMTPLDEWSCCCRGF
jgi:hypothetical protein